MVKKIFISYPVCDIILYLWQRVNFLGSLLFVDAVIWTNKKVHKVEYINLIYLLSLNYPVISKHLTNFMASPTKYSLFYTIWDISGINRLCMRPLYVNWLKKGWRKFCLNNFNKILCFLLDLVCLKPPFFTLVFSGEKNP